MISTNTIYNLVADVFLSKKQSGAFTIDAFNTACQAVNYDILKWKVGLPEAYQMGAPYPPIAYQVTQKITDDVRQFIVIADIQKNNSGYFQIPDDYFAFSSLRYRYVKNNSCGEPEWVDIDIPVLDDGEFNMRLRNTIVPPQVKYPIANYYNYGIKIMPEQISKVKLTYLKKPQTPVWAYTVVDDQPVYDAANSVDFDYPVSCTNDIAVMVGKYMGLNLLFPEVVQFLEQRQDKGK